MKKYNLLVWAFCLLMAGACSDDEPVVPPVRETQ